MRCYCKKRLHSNKACAAHTKMAVHKQASNSSVGPNYIPGTASVHLVQVCSGDCPGLAKGVNLLHQSRLCLRVDGQQVDCKGQRVCGGLIPASHSVTQKQTGCDVTALMTGTTKESGSSNAEHLLHQASVGIDICLFVLMYSAETWGYCMRA